MSREMFKNVLEKDTNFSPMTSLALNLDAASLINTPCKKLCLSFASECSSEQNDSDVDFPVLALSPDKDDIRSPVPGPKRRKRKRDGSSSMPTPLKQIQNLHSPFQQSKKAKMDAAYFKNIDQLALKKTPNVKLEYNSPVKFSPMDTESRDSGFGDSCQKKNTCSSLTKLPTRKLDLDSSPVKSSIPGHDSFTSLSNQSSYDEELILEFACSPPKDENLRNLITAPLMPIDSPEERMPFRRSLSLVDGNTPVSSREPSTQTQFKRPAPKDSTVTKRFDPCASDPISNAENLPPAKKIFKCFSESQVTVMMALDKSESSKEKLTGDFSRPLALPCLPDAPLNNISSHTLADLIKGKYEDFVGSYQIFDCRYPYEYNGGHIQGSVNWPSLECAHNLYHNTPSPPGIPKVTDKRHVVIFHCEFSAERGPRMQKYLREMDRSGSFEGDRYPALYFPELYLLEGGYKNFYASYPDLCDPNSYVSMFDKRFSQEKKLYRSKSKSWASENKIIKRTLSRLREN